MRNNTMITKNDSEKGAALVMVLLMMSLMLALTMGISLTSVSELGVSNTYANQTQAFQAAEAGLNHAVGLIRNYTGGDFTALLAERGTISNNYLTGNNPFTNSAHFDSHSVMMTDDSSKGHSLYSANTDPSGNLTPVPGAYYSVHLIDDEKSTSAASVKVPNFNLAAAWEDGNPATDTNNRVVLYSTGTYGSSSVTLEAWVGFIPYPAFVAQRDVVVSGNAQIQGAYGGVHSNNNLTVAASADIAQTATAVGTGTFTTSGNIGGFHAGGQDRLYIPKFVTAGTSTSSPHLQDYIVQKADVILLDPGFANGATRDLTGSSAATVRLRKLADSLGIPSSQYSSFTAAVDSNSSGVVDQTNPEAVSISRGSTSITFSHSTSNLSSYGWSYSSGDWNIPSNSTGASGHTFYVVGVDNYNFSTPSASPKNGGNVKITGNAGSLAHPLHTTILSTGSITLTGNPYMEANLTSMITPELPPFVSVNILMAAVQDLDIRGDVGAGSGIIRFNGICYAGEQVYLSGNGEISGQVLALNNTNAHGTTGSNASPVDRDDNEITGSFTLDFNGGQAVGKVSLMSWRQIKQ
ncbi:MAG: PilX N-terminal domain-containing pilus assembly protein [Blastocatellia bacterium]